MGTTLGDARRVSNSVGIFAVIQFSSQSNGNTPGKVPTRSHYCNLSVFSNSANCYFGDSSLQSTTTKNGASYVRENYSWPKIVGVTRAF